MKKILFLLLFTIASYGQAVFDEGIQIKNNTTDNSATKVNVQSTDGKVNTQAINTAFNKNFGLNSGDVVGATTLLNQYSTTPIDWTATTFASGKVVFYGGKQWVAKIATVAGDVPAVSSKWEEITFEALANKTTTVDQTIIDGSTNSVSGNAVFDGLALKSNIGHTHVASQITDLSKASVGLGNVDNTSDLSKPLSTATINALATKAPISSVHNPVTLGTPNGLSLSNQQLSLGLASSSTTGALSGTDWNTFNNKENAFSKNTAFNKPFGITAGTVVEGGTLGSNAYTSTAYLPLSGGTINANNETINYKVSSNNGALYNSWYDFNNNRISFLGFGGGTQSNAPFVIASENGGNIALNTTGVGKVVVSSLSGSGDGNIVASSDGVLKRGVALGSNAYSSTAYLPLSGGTLTGALNGTSATFSSTVTASPATTANQVVVKSQLDAVAGTSGSYTPTGNVITGATSVLLQSHTYIKIGNIVTVYGESKPTPIVSGVTVIYEISLPIARANTTTKALGFGSMNVAGGGTNQFVRLESSSATTVRISFNVSAAGTPSVLYSLQYDITQ